VDQHRVRAGLVVGARAAQRLGEAPARDEGLDAGDDAEIIVGPRIPGGLDLAAELVDVGERLPAAFDEAVGLGEQLVFQADGRDAALPELRTRRWTLLKLP